MLVALLISTPFWQHFSAVMTRLNRLFQIVRDPYRPELHYMRGPGPKWHAKHQGRHR
jgi:hypothetical protein